MVRNIKYTALAMVLLAFIPASALADAAMPQPTLALPTDQVWTIIAGSLVPLVAYVLNKYGPHTSEKMKAFVHIIAAAVAGGLVEAITVGGVGFNDVTLQFVMTAIVTALAAHGFLWKPSGISTALGGGQNA